MTTLICLGVITSPHGIKGAVKIKTFTEKPEDISSYGNLLCNDQSYEIDVISILDDSLLIATINGVKSRNEAELLRNKKLYVTRSNLPKLSNENEFYHSDLINIEVRSKDNELYGYVRCIHNFGSEDILEISVNSTKKNIMLSFTKEIFPYINIKERYITINIPTFIN
ncbi:MAG: ribosome maturation factor RimM [Wolbachia endosymbiont of Fragariocoptes setiger]|nr:ribosome maturation factor RimM [Wolbachia endosymbiont of Fragariocoptes setiger]